MPTITVLPSGTTVDASAEDTILFSLLVGGVPIRTECTARAQCNQCHILVHEGIASLSKIAGPEFGSPQDDPERRGEIPPRLPGHPREWRCDHRGRGLKPENIGEKEN